MASVDYIFKTVKYDTQTVNLTATVHLPKDTTSVNAIGEAPTRSLYRREKYHTNNPKPKALYFHGGGYIVGSRATLPAAHIEALNKSNFIAVSSDYRLGPTISVLDGPVSDSVAAFEWAQNELPRLLEKEHGITVDGKNIVTLGHSCGGGLALLMVSNTLQL
jgi:acetyl esterase/lipase